jgi:late competence protein required for DNA uptake (superfamily II DNA/RNA helicase)
MNNQRVKMVKNDIKYFGELIIGETKDDEEINIKFIGKDILITLPEFVINDKNKVKKCFEAMAKYIEIDDAAKKYIIKNYPQTKRVKMNSKYYFYNLENNKIEFFGIIDDDRKNIVENIMNKELKIIEEE